MTPAARLQAAIEVLDHILDGAPAERALTNWARTNRYAGAKDRAAVRDHVYDCLRCRRSFAALGGAGTGRGLILGMARSIGDDVTRLFDGAQYAPDVIGDHENPREPTGYEAWDMPDWIAERLRADHGEMAEDIAKALRTRAPVFLRVNLLKTDVESAMRALANEGITVEKSALATTALTVTDGARQVAQSAAYQKGFVELQDAASQAVVEFTGVSQGARVLDYCAGGGGKSLALAALTRAEVTAHDISEARMRDIASRAERAGARIKTMANPTGTYDLVFVDAPCSGSGSWRRDPEGKWRLTPETLEQTCQTQAEILDQVGKYVAPNGILAYATCSVLACENRDQVDAFVARHPEWKLIEDRQFLPQDGGDGFYISIFKAE